jgi:Outer membrane protein beta-barrel domain
VKTVFLTAIPLLLCFVVFSQKKTFIGVEGNLANDRLSIEDNGGQLQHVPLLAPLVGVTVRQDLSQHFFTEIGFFYKPYDEGIGFKVEDNGYETGTGFDSWIVPFRLGTYIKTHNKKIRLTPVIGYSICKNQDYGYDSVYAPGTGSWDYTITRSDSVAYSYSVTYNNKTFSLLQIGLGIEIKLLKTLNLNFSANYYFGLNPVYEQDVLYRINGSPNQSAKMTSNGQFWSVGVGLQYPISNLWVKK